MKADDSRHGTVAGYNRIPCRDECCRRAMAKYKQNWHLDQMRGKSRIVPALGLQRRLQALAALGWSNAEVARRAGMHPEHLPRIMRVATITRETHERVAAVYDELSMQLPTSHPQAIAATQNRARRNGWPPPLAWDDIDDPDEKPARATEPNGRKGYIDHAAVERRLHGDRSVRVNHAEAAEVVRRALRAGRSTVWIEERLGLKPERYMRKEDAA